MPETAPDAGALEPATAATSWEARIARAASQLGDGRARQLACPMRRQQREALRTLAQDVGDSPVPLRTLHAIVRRCVEEPGEARWRRLRLANPRMEREVVAHAGGVDFLKAAGFAPAEFGTVLVLSPIIGRPEAVRQLHTALASLHAAAAAVPGGALQLPVVDLGPSTRAAVGLMTVLTGDDLRQAVLSQLSAVELWPLRRVAKAFSLWVDVQLAELHALSIGEMLAQKSSAGVLRREFPLLVSRCTSLKSLEWGKGGGRATPRHADALACTLASGLRRARAPLQSLRISGPAALSWNGFASMLNEAGEGVTSALYHLEFVAGESASELTELAESGDPAIDPTTGALLGHSSGVALGGALASCANLHTITLAGGGGDAGPNCTTLAAVGAWCPRLQSLSLDGCISVDGAAIAALVDGTTSRAVLATPQHGADAAVVVPGLGRKPSQSQCPDGPTSLCSTLTCLDVSGCPAMSDVGLQALHRAGVRLNSLRANDCRSLSDHGVCCVVNESLATLELASRRQVGDQTLCCLADTGPCLTALDISSGHRDVLPLSSEALLKLVEGCPRMVDFRAAYATLSVQFILAIGDKWSSSGDLSPGLTQLDLSFCKTAATDDAVVVCETLAQALAQCSHIRTLALAGFAAMRPNAVTIEETAPAMHHPADVVVATVLAECTKLTDLNCSETDIGADAVAGTLLGLDCTGDATYTVEGPCSVGLTRVNFSGCQRLGGETFVALLRVCPHLVELNLGYCCNEEHAQVAAAEARGRLRAQALGSGALVDPGGSTLTDARPITDNDLSCLRTARCAPKLQGLRLGGMGSRNGVPWPTVGDSTGKAFGNDGVSAALRADDRSKHLSALKTVDLSHSPVTNVTVLQLALTSPDLSRLNVVGSKCTRELHRMLREADCTARVFGI